MAITLKTVMSELAFINELATDNKGDPRLPALLDAVKRDLAVAAQSIAGDNPIIDK
jgi:hypothetical protein